jgi:hypothetical protein
MCAIRAAYLRLTRAEHLTSFDRRVFDACVCVCFSYSWLAAATTASQLAMWVYDKPADTVPGWARKRVMESLRRLQDAGVLAYRAHVGRPTLFPTTKFENTLDVEISATNDYPGTIENGPPRVGPENESENGPPQVRPDSENGPSFDAKRALESRETGPTRTVTPRNQSEEVSEETSLRPRSRPRLEHEEIYEALLSACDISRPFPSNAEGKYRKATKELAQIGVSVSDIPARARVYREKWPNATISPSALAKHWGECASQRSALPEFERCSACGFWVIDCECFSDGLAS